ncbi:MAG TPA: hypothetical protein VGO58_00610 [Chitinophagaceae bacterium]|jgi:hypothetical protein|nr:hypothetical protein [Chitinophagaceae bacterium]
MKYIYSLLLILAGYTASAQIYFNAGYSYSSPQQEMAKNINGLHSLSTGFMYRFPGKLSRIQAGIDLSWGMYADEQKKQTFNFGGGFSTETWVNYTSNVAQVRATARVFLLEDKQVMPYISGKAGYTNFYSNVYIEDPHDPNGCKALDQDNIIKDGIFSVAYGGGLQFDWRLFGSRKQAGRRYIDISVNNIRGGKISYINTKKLIDANNPPVGSNGKPLTVRFINASTQEIHEHQVAEVYTTSLRMLEFKISTVFLLDWGR